MGGSSLQEGQNLVVSGTNASWTCDDDDDDDADLCTASKILTEATYLVNSSNMDWVKKQIIKNITERTTEIKHVIWRTGKMEEGVLRDHRVSDFL